MAETVQNKRILTGFEAILEKKLLFYPENYSQFFLVLKFNGINVCIVTHYELNKMYLFHK